MQNTIRKKAAPVVPALNYHLWEPCNMRCRFCFSRFNATEANSNQEARGNAFKVLDAAINAGISKITFVGGEPLLCPWLPDAPAYSKSNGLTTMVVSNGSLLSNRWLDENSSYVDWFAISIDSVNEQTNYAIGRRTQSEGALSREQYSDRIALIASYGIKLKINTVVSSFNLHENMSDFIIESNPERWKIFQALKVIGQNDSTFEPCRVTKGQFEAYVRRHSLVSQKCHMAIENNDSMTGSYLMVNPAGRFFDNSTGEYHYSSPIWQTGWEEALSEVSVSDEKFIKRGGLYDW